MARTPGSFWTEPQCTAQADRESLWFNESLDDIPVQFDIYGRMSVEILREADNWVAYRLDTGKRIELRDLAIPSSIDVEELASYLDDLYHEMARPGEVVRRVDVAIEIRPLSHTDSMEELTGLLHAAYAKLGQMGLNYTAVDQPVEVTRARAKAGVCLVAVSEGRLVGTITVQRPLDDPACPYFAKSHVASAHQLAVAPSHQGDGLGSRLLATAEGWAAANGYSELVLDTAEPAHHLVELYRRRGYEFVGFVQWRGKCYRSVLMAKRVG